MRHSHHLRFFRSIVLAFAAIASGALALSAGQTPPPATPLPRTVQLKPADAARAAADARKGVSVTVPPGLELKLFASEDLLVDPVALEFDDKGTLYVVSTSRANLPLDIRGHPTWVPTVHTLKTVPDLLNFYKKELAPERSAQNRWIPDLNKDGSNDIRDLAEFKERLYRIQDTNGDGVADASRIMIEGFNADPTYDVVGGILFNEGDLLFGIAPGVWRLKDDNGDGTIDRQIAISEGYSTHPAFAGHGISGLMMGPDGRLYWEVGDIGLDVTDKSGKRWSYPNQGAVLRSDPDGSNFEVYATGIRNLQEFSFDEFGNLISVDNDGDHQGETERVVYIPNGSDSGWRSNWQYGKYTDPKNNRYNVWMDEQLFKPRFDGRPRTSFRRSRPITRDHQGWRTTPARRSRMNGATRSSSRAFPARPSNARIYGFKLKEDGAGFALDSDRVLLQGILAIGLKFGPDGALYLTDWITGWQSKNKGRVWALDSPQAASSPVRAEVKKVLGERLDARSAGDVASLLRHADMRVRQKAQFELVRRGDIQSLTTASGDAQSRLARIHGIWGIAQLARKNDSHAAALVRLLKDGDDEVRAQSAKMLGDVRYARAGEPLMPLLKDRAPRVRFFAAEALGRIAYKPAVPPLVEMLAANDDKDVLSAARGEPRAVAHRRGGRRRRPLDAYLARRPHRRRHRAAAHAQCRRRPIPDRCGRVGRARSRASHQRRWVDRRGAAGARARAGRQALHERAAPAGARSAPASRSARRMPRRGSRRSRPIRNMPVRCASKRSRRWASGPSPSTMDRVDGIYIGQPPARDPAVARDAILEMLQAAEADDSMKIALAEAAGRLSLQEAAPILLTQLKSDPSADVRVAALRGLEALKPSNISEIMKVAIGDASPEVRRAAVAILPSLPLGEAEKVQNLVAVIRGGTASDQQAGVGVLGGMKSPEAQNALAMFFDELTAGKLAREVHADLVDTMQASESPALENKLEAYRKSKSADSLAAAFRESLLLGGDPRRAQQVFAEHPAAACVRCHAVGKDGGADVGPNLAGVGTRLTREQLLESLLEPNARIAQGYGTVSVTLKNGERVDGMLRSETDTHIVVMTGTPLAEKSIAKSDVAERTNPVSAMPPVGQILKLREIRDLVAGLATLK